MHILLNKTCHMLPIIRMMLYLCKLVYTIVCVQHNIGTLVSIVVYFCVECVYCGFVCISV